MISYEKITLDNGLTVVVHRDKVSKMAAVNMLYRVGARNEDPLRTGFAHLFEHLMFRGTKAVPDFDEPLQRACGENNAFTNNDYTDFYITLPKDNIETALWLEADRMQGLEITPDVLETEKRVVIEEFNQRYLNLPYGDTWFLLREMAYKVHPYRWPTIGLSPEHIAGASLVDVEAFYHRYYQPDNAILSIAADMDTGKMLGLAEKWFGGIPRSGFRADRLPVEPAQAEPRRLEHTADVPADSITIAFCMGSRKSSDFYCLDLISDMLAGGASGRLYQRLVKERGLFSNVNAYITGDVDPGLFVVTGSLQPSTTFAQAEEELRSELEMLKSNPVSDYDMEKVKNKFEANTIFGELNVMNKAMNLGFYEMLGDIGLVNEEVEIYRSVTAKDVQMVAQNVFKEENSSTLLYGREKRD
jgi:predicted Zn-dependent peptidase